MNTAARSQADHTWDRRLAALLLETSCFLFGGALRGTVKGAQFLRTICAIYTQVVPYCAFSHPQKLRRLALAKTGVDKSFRSLLPGRYGQAKLAFGGVPAFDAPIDQVR